MSATTETSSGIEVRGPVEGRAAEILTPAALDFVAGLERRFGAERTRLLKARVARQAKLDAGALPDFLEETREVRESDWQVAPAPPELQDRRVEITGPVDRKMVINALNSGARVFMADFEDANSPTWSNNVEGQVNLRDANAGTISLDTGEKRYELGDDPAVLLVRPRGWHLVERHVEVDGAPISASLFDFGLYLFHNRAKPWFYLPKLESHVEARLWNDVFDYAEDELELARGTIKATVLIETVLAAFEMDEILYELREHIVGLNAGRWDYLFSLIKRLRSLDVVLPGPRPPDDDDAVHARLHRAAREDDAPARGARDGRDGGLHPEPARPRGERGRAEEGARGQGARGRRRLRRHVGRAPGPGPGGDGGLRRRPRRPRRTRSPGSATTSRSRPATSSTSASRAARSPRTGCARTSASGSGTSSRGCAGSAPRRSTT